MCEAWVWVAALPERATRPDQHGLGALVARALVESGMGREVRVWDAARSEELTVRTSLGWIERDLEAECVESPDAYKLVERACCYPSAHFFPTSC